MPPQLALPLLTGPLPVHVRPAPRRPVGPAAVPLDVPACMVSLFLPPTDGLRLDELAAELVRQRLVDVVRHEEGLTYVLDDERFLDVPHPSGGRGSDLLVGAEPLESRLVPAVETFVHELLALLSDGPRDGELDPGAGPPPPCA